MLHNPNRPTVHRDLDPVDELSRYESPEENQERDPHGWRLKLLVATIGLDALGPDEKERLQCTYDGDRHQLIKLRKQAETRQSQDDAHAQFALAQSEAASILRRLASLERWGRALDGWRKEFYDLVFDYVAKSNEDFIRNDRALTQEFKDLEAKFGKQLESTVAGLMIAFKGVASETAVEAAVEEISKAESRQGTANVAIEARLGIKTDALEAKIGARIEAAVRTEVRGLQSLFRGIAVEAATKIVTEIVTETIGASDKRKEVAIAKAIEAIKEHIEIEIAVTRDELGERIDRKVWGGFTESPATLAAAAGLHELRENFESWTLEEKAALVGLAEQIEGADKRRRHDRSAWRKEVADLGVKLTGLADRQTAAQRRRVDELIEEVRSLRQILIDAELAEDGPMPPVLKLS
jgi:hypothetical protein